MAKDKTYAKGKKKTTPGTAVQKKPAAPAKVDGPQKEARSPEVRRAAGEAPGRARSMKEAQQTVGNARVNQMAETAVQPKLTVSSATDSSEQEANRVADTVMRQLNDEKGEGKTAVAPGEQKLQRQPADEAEPKEAKPAAPAKSTIQRQPMNEDSSPLEAAKTAPEPAEAPAGVEAAAEAQEEAVSAEPDSPEPNEPEADPPDRPAITPEVAAQVRALEGFGQPLPADLRTRFESRLGHDLRHVRIHTGSRAAALARSLNARAFAYGRNIVFAAGQYQPETAVGQQLLVHELVHVCQQTTRVKPATLQRKVLMAEPGSGGAGITWQEMNRRSRRRFVRRHFRRGSRSRRRLARRIMRDMAASDDEFKFSNEAELRSEMVKRVEASRLMQQTQAHRGSRRRAFGYPFTSPSLFWGPRVNYAARNYWTPRVVDNYSRRRNRTKRREIRNLSRRKRYTVYGDPAPGYEWSLSPAGRADPYKAITRLFVRQRRHKRTLIHCDYLISLVHLRAFARDVGRAEFNRRLKAFGVENITLRAKTFEHLQLETIIGGRRVPGIGSLQKIRPSSPDDLVIGDHVYFWNHEAYDLLNSQFGNAWRLENAILIDQRRRRDIFLGHGSGRKTRRQMKRKLSREYNEVARIALRLARRITRSRGQRLIAARAERARRFPFVRYENGSWRVKGRRFGRRIDMPLREIRPDEVMGLYDPWHPGLMYWVRRPSESRE